MSTCPNTGVRDFPIKTTVNITDALVASISDSILLDIQWATRATAPVFRPGISSGFLQEGTSGTSGGSTTTVRLQGNTYTLQSVQICKPLHSEFLKTADKPTCKAELLLIFKTGAELLERYVFFCVPLLQTSTSSPNIYLESLLNGRLPGNPISLNTLIPPPADQTFFSYSTCMSQVTASQTTALFSRVFIFMKGIRHPRVEDLLGKIVIRMGLRGAGLTSSEFPDVSLPDSLRGSTMPMPFLLDNETTFGQYMRSGTLTGKEFGRPGDFREDTTSAYKCVPLNPDLQVENGRVKVDVTKGELLSKVLSDRSADLQGDLGKESMNAEQFERMMAIAFGIAIGLVVLMIVAYFISRITASPSSYAPGPITEMPSFIKTATPIMFVSALVGVLGFAIGGLVVYYAL